MTKALSIWFSAPRRVDLRVETVNPPAPGNVQVRAISSAISHGTEMLVYRGEVDATTARDLPTLAGDFAFPIKYGYASVGRVEALGSDVKSLATGDVIFCLHPHQTVYNAPVTLTRKLPRDLEPALGVFYANLETALNIVHDTPLHFGETVLLCGGGVVGLLTLQLLKRRGARVLVLEPQATRRAIALEFGADAAFPPDNDIATKLRAVNNGRAVDVAIEVSGAPAALQQAIDHVLDDGTVVVASWYGTKPVTLDLGGHFHRGRVQLRSSQVGRMRPELNGRWNAARRDEAIIALLQQLRLHDLISHRFQLSAAVEAYQVVERGEALQAVFLYEHASIEHRTASAELIL